MCGIYGMVAPAAEVLRTEILARMDAALLHRGPDGDGLAVRSRAALGVRRLGIMDPSGVGQPFADETGAVVAVCNGEIYNYRVLRADLEARGHVFATRNDSEVVPHLYEEHGIDFVHALEGMFALAVWDGRTGRLVLARDRMGEKPLYHATTERGFLFASEPRALVASGWVDRDPDWHALARYLTSGHVPAPSSAFRAVAKLPPGGRLVLEGESARVDRYWHPAPFASAPPLALDLATAAQAVRTRLTAAVQAALMSDVPLGVFLSGGLDSTGVAALARAHDGRELPTFALGFDVPGYDEREWASQAARALGTRHRALTITPESFAAGAQELTASLGEPLADPALVPTFLLSRFAREYVKTVLVGEGGDELFAGYPTYLGAALAASYRRLPGAVRRSLAAAAPVLGAPRGNTTIRYLLRRFLEEADEAPAVRHLRWTGCVPPARLAALAAPDGPLALPPPPTPPAARTALDALLTIDLTGALPDSLLTKLDRATMAASLEGRAPFMDRALVELACRLPIEHKLRGLETKRVLRRALGDLVPPPILRRTKRGLTVPLAPWLAGPLRQLARTTLDRLDPGVVRRDAVRALLDEHVERRRDNRREIWALMMLQLWRDATRVW